MLFVLRADYPVPANASIGVQNLIQALKTYGAYVIDQGASFELDADSTHPELWSQAGVGSSSLPITSADMRLVHLGSGGTPAPSTSARLQHPHRHQPPHRHQRRLQPRCPLRLRRPRLHRRPHRHRLLRQRLRPRRAAAARPVARPAPSASSEGASAGS